MQQVTFIHGWPLVGWSSLIIGGIALLLLGALGAGEEGLHAVARTTARTSAVLFLAVFTASAARKMWKTEATKWMLANRRYLGVSFAASHTIHLASLVALSIVAQLSSDAVTIVAGGTGFVFVAAMTATSFDRTAAWLGPRRWKTLHRVGLYYLWFIFLFTFAGSAGRRLASALFASAFLGAFVLRLVVWVLDRRRAAEAVRA